MEFFFSLSLYAKVGYVSSVLLALLAAWGLLGFFPRPHQWASRMRTANTGPAWLILAIWLGFLGLFTNSMYWRVWGDPAVYYGLITVDQLRYVGHRLDTVWKGVGAIAIYMHFYARYKSISSDSEKAQWTPLLMAFYPDSNHWAYRALRFAMLTSLRDRFTRKS
jgi:hypothetical protein